jgi:DNA mismatch repair protein MutL
MNNIRRLQEHEIRMIAAGEVVDRPANALKELIENALDAGSSSLTITLKQGGTQLMSVADDGSGMSEEQALLALQHHTTSKLPIDGDLHAISTFGFRGEALSSICAVSTTVLTTRSADNHAATSITITAGTVTNIEACAAPCGTTVAVHELFSHLPARRKFLKSTQTELRACLQVITAAALARPDVAYTVITDHDTVTYPKTTNLAQRCLQLFDLATQGMITASFSHHGVTIEGCLGLPTTSRYDRSGLYLFVNGRWIKNSKLTTRIITAYGQMLPPGRFPVGAVAITCPADQVDINTHPRKEEVVFLHPKQMENSVFQAVRQALDAACLEQFQPSPAAAEKAPPFVPTPLSGDTPQAPQTASWPTISLNRTLPDKSEASTETKHLPPGPFMPPSLTAPPRISSAMNMVQETVPLVTAPSTTQQPWQLLGQADKTYLIVTTPEGLLLIDQHAAHERILYDRLRAQAASTASASTPLLFPTVIPLPRHAIELLLQHASLLALHGISISAPSDQHVVITYLPPALVKTNHQELVQLLLREFETSDTENPTASGAQERHEHAVCALMACKAAVKAGDALGDQEMKDLIRQLEETPGRATCPHGRPTTHKLTWTAIEKLFKRT